VYLRTVGLDLGDIPVKFGWELELFKPVVEQTRSEGGFESGVDFGVLGTRSEPVLDLGGFEIGVELFLMLVRLNPSLHLFLSISGEHRLIIWIGWPILIWMRSHQPPVK